MSKSIHSPEHRALLQLLIEARHKAGLTQDQVARCLKRPQSFVAKYEGGERRIDVIEFIAITNALDHDPRRLFEKLMRLIQSGKSTRLRSTRG